MKKSLYSLILVLALSAGAFAAQETPKAGAIKPASLAAQQASTAQPAPTAEQVDEQIQSLYIEAGARVERIRVAQGELDQIKKNIEQLTAYKQQMGKTSVKTEDRATSASK